MSSLAGVFICARVVASDAVGEAIGSPIPIPIPIPTHYPFLITREGNAHRIWIMPTDTLSSRSNLWCLAISLPRPPCLDDAQAAALSYCARRTVEAARSGETDLARGLSAAAAGLSLRTFSRAALSATALPGRARRDRHGHGLDEWRLQRWRQRRWAQGRLVAWGRLAQIQVWAQASSACRG